MNEQVKPRITCGDEIYEYVKPEEVMKIEQSIYRVEFDKVIDKLKALSNPIRLKILYMLLQKELPVCIISNILRLDQTLISHHLAILREKSIVDVKIRGKYRFYYLKDGNVKKLINLLVKDY